MKQYRLPFFSGLEKNLASSGIQLRVVYGEPWPEEVKRGDNAMLPAPLGYQVPTYRLFKKILFQPSLRPWLDADLIVLEPANKHALNYFLMFLHCIGLKHVGYWGHGYDRQSSVSTWGNKFKRKTLHCSSWWFAYTKGAAKYLVDEGFDASRTTIVANAVDTHGFQKQLQNSTTQDIAQMRASLGWDEQVQIGVFCGSLYVNKKLDFLFDAAKLINTLNPNFRLLVLGGGPLADEVRVFADEHPWVRYVGPTFGAKKAIMLKMSDIWLNPGLIGLGILDGFCAGLPVITTDVTFHSPEIEYLDHGVNGLIVAADVAIYAETVLTLLNDDERYAKLCDGALASAEQHNIERMVCNFAKGVRQCLNVS